MSDQVVLFEIRDKAAWITLNRPTALNALIPAVVQGIDSALDEVEKHPEVCAVVVTGAGRAFSAGADLKFIRESSGGDPRALQNFLQSIYVTFNRLEHFPRPVIAAVNGYALGGGLELALACDFIYASEKAKMGLPEVTLGIMPGFGGTQNLARLIGPNKANELVFTS